MWNKTYLFVATQYEVNWTVMCNSVTQLYFREVWFIWGSNFITKCQKVKKKNGNFKLFTEELKPALLSLSFYTVGEFYSFEYSLFVKYFYQLYQINIMLSHHGIVSYCIVLYCIVLYCIGQCMVISLLHHIDKYFMNVTVWDLVYTL
jgi:hypothetical protein